MKLLLILTTILVSASPPLSASASQLEDVVVKVRSFPCLTRSPLMEGSGMLLNRGGKTLVLTSEHVVFHANEPYCHTIAFSDGPAETPVKLLRADWGSGLALFQASRTLTAPSIAAVSDGDTVSRVMSKGYPAGQTQLYADDQGKVLQMRSARHLFAQQLTMIEIKDLHGEFGMSGSAVFAQTAAGPRWLGILSHQVLQIVAGGRTKIDTSGSFSGGASGSNDAGPMILLAVPAYAAERWISATLSGGFTADDFRRDTGAQARGEEIVTLGALTFKRQWMSRNDLAQIGGGNGAGVGGADGAGVGGGDGAGVGGGDGAGVGGAFDKKSDTPPSESAFSVRVTIDRSRVRDGAQRWGPLVARSAWLASIQAQLLRGKEVIITGITEPGNLGFMSNVVTLARFFQLLMKADTQPIALVRGGFAGADAQVSKLFETARALDQAIDKTVNGAQTPEMKSLAESIQLLARRLRSLDWATCSPQDLDDLRSNPKFAGAWNAWLLVDFDGAADVGAKIELAREQLGRLKISQ